MDYIYLIYHLYTKTAINEHYPHIIFIHHIYNINKKYI